MESGSTSTAAPPPATVESFTNLVETCIEAYDQDDKDKVESLLLSALAFVRETPAKPNSFVCVSLLAIAKRRHGVFQIREVMKVLVSMLRREGTQVSPLPSAISKPGFFVPAKTTSGTALPLLVCNLLYAACKDVAIWPHDFVSAYLEDAIGDRIWVDHQEAKFFVDNVITAFPAATSSPGDSRSKVLGGEDDDDGDVEELDSGLSSLKRGAKGGKESSVGPGADDSHVRPRFNEPKIQEKIRLLASTLVRENVQRKTSGDSSQRNLARVASLLGGYKEVVHYGSHRLDEWLNFPSTTRYAKEFMQRLSETITTVDPADLEAFDKFLGIKPKSQVDQLYAECLLRILGNNSSYVQHAIQFLANGELGMRNPNSNFFKLCNAIIRFQPQEASLHLGVAVQEHLVLSRPDALSTVQRMLPQFITTTNPAYPSDFDFASFLQGLFRDNQKKLDPKIPALPFFTSMVELYHFGISQLLHFNHRRSSNLAPVQGTIASWLRASLTSGFAPSGDLELLTTRYGPLLVSDCKLLVRKVFGLPDKRLPESERHALEKCNPFVALGDEALRALLAIPLPVDFIFEVTDAVIRRNSSFPPRAGYNPFQLKDAKIPESFYALTIYRPPATISIPQPTPPFGVADLFWRASVDLAILAGFCPATVGRAIWTQYPPVRLLLEMLITHHFQFPPLTDRGDDIQMELQVARLEKDDTIAFETQVASAHAGSEMTITEATSQFLTSYKLLRLDLTGPRRRPPPDTLATLRDLDQGLRLGFKLSCSRDPDFLSDVMVATQHSREGGPPDSFLDWLAPVLEADPATIEALPLTVLCDLFSQAHQRQEDLVSLLLSRTATSPSVSTQTLLIYKKLLGYLYITGDAPNLLAHFFGLLASSQVKRSVAAKSLHALVCGPEVASAYLGSPLPIAGGGNGQIPTEVPWLKLLPQLPCFPQVSALLFDALVSALSAETKPDLLGGYASFLLSMTLTSHKERVPAITEAFGTLFIDRPIASKPLLATNILASKFAILFLELFKPGKLIETTKEVPVFRDGEVLVLLVTSKSVVLPRKVLGGILMYLSLVTVSGMGTPLLRLSHFH